MSELANGAAASMRYCRGFLCDFNERDCGGVSMSLALRLGRIAVLLIVTAAAFVAMLYVSIKSAAAPKKEAVAAPTAPPKARVAIQPVKLETIEILDTYSGMIEPWERYSLGFEVAGRVQALGLNEDESPLDDGDRVASGQVLARLDDRILEAQMSEASARLRQATLDLKRMQDLRKRSPGAVTETEILERETAQTLAIAQRAIAKKNLTDSTLFSPVEGVIAKRLINPGESVNPHQPIFELVETDKLRLVVGVPESRIPHLDARRREVERNRKLQRQAVIDPEDMSFRVYVALLSRNRLGEKWPLMVGTVHQIAETADETTGLFDVEVLLPNPERKLKPGMVARARFVTDRVRGYRVPESSVLVRGGEAHLFTLRTESDEMQANLPEGESAVYHAHRVPLRAYIEQDGQMIVPEPDQPIRVAIVRGQHRLTEGQAVEVVGEPEQTPSSLGPGLPIASPAVGARTQ